MQRRYIFPGINHTLRTNMEYERSIDEDHHKDGKSPLSMLLLGMVSHLLSTCTLYVGCNEKVIHRMGMRQIFTDIQIILLGPFLLSTSKWLEILVEYCPSDFTRPPGPFNACSKYKATEYRHRISFFFIQVQW